MKCKQWRCYKAYWLQLATLLLLFVSLHHYFSYHQSSVMKSKAKVGEGGRKLFGNDEMDSKVSQLLASDSRVVDFVKSQIRRSTNWNYNLTEPDRSDFSRGQSQVIDTYFKKKTQGVFIEAGAYDGERHSVSLFFEKSRDWEGLLIEANPKHYGSLINKNRRCSSLHVCVRTNDTGDSKIYGNDTVPCFWMESILAATSLKHVDLLSIDIKDNEIAVINTIPFDKYEIEVVTVEFADRSTAQGDVLKLMYQKGFKALHQFVNIPIHKSDLVFVRMSGNM